ncbi:MAG: hypothetical protein JW937_03410 [Candidatus Omnitrophica bacterium]|nr:hypothetical protein [Candidatus Omnitrophota bacterium]
MESRSLTIVFTDMKGFTSRTSSQSRTATEEMIFRHKELLLPVIKKRGGQLIKSIGDAFLLTFESPTDAVLAGMDIQEKLRKFNLSVPSPDRIEVRVAINTGEVIVDEGDVYGEAVNIASRIEGIAEPNEVYFTESTYLSMNKSEVPSAEIGYRLLKGIPEKIKIFKVLKEGQTAPALSGSGMRAVPAVASGPPPDKKYVVWILALVLGVAGVALAVHQMGEIKRQQKETEIRQWLEDYRRGVRDLEGQSAEFEEQIRQGRDDGAHFRGAFQRVSGDLARIREQLPVYRDRLNQRIERGLSEAAGFQDEQRIQEIRQREAGLEQVLNEWEGRFEGAARAEEELSRQLQEWSWAAEEWRKAANEFRRRIEGLGDELNSNKALEEWSWVMDQRNEELEVLRYDLDQVIRDAGRAFLDVRHVEEALQQSEELLREWERMAREFGLRMQGPQQQQPQQRPMPDQYNQPQSQKQRRY